MEGRTSGPTLHPVNEILARPLAPLPPPLRGRGHFGVGTDRERSNKICRPHWVSHFATVRHGGESRIHFRVCSPACRGEPSGCEAASWRSRTEGAASSIPAFVDSLSWTPSVFAKRRNDLPHFVGEDTSGWVPTARGRTRSVAPPLGGVGTGFGESGGRGGLSSTYPVATSHVPAQISSNTGTADKPGPPFSCPSKNPTR